MVNAAAAAPLAARNFRRETPGEWDWFGVSLVFIPDLISKDNGAAQASSCTPRAIYLDNQPVAELHTLVQSTWIWITLDYGATRSPARLSHCLGNQA